MKALYVKALSETEYKEVEGLYQRTKEARLARRAQMILLSGEGWKVGEIAKVVRESEDTVTRWVKRYNSEGVNGLQDAPRAGAPRKVNAEYEAEVLAAVRTRPRALEQPYSLWTLQRLVDYMAERTGIRLGRETLRRLLARHEIVMSRPHYHVHSPDPDYLLKKKQSRRNVPR